MIVGQNPGKNPNGPDTEFAWGPSPSAKLVFQAIDVFDNIVMTNAWNWQDMEVEHIIEGQVELQELIERTNPYVILCFGKYAEQAVRNIGTKVPVYNFWHPSYVLRYNGENERYVRRIRKVITNSVQELNNDV